jgi:hypothetical protein
MQLALQFELTNTVWCTGLYFEVWSDTRLRFLTILFQLRAIVAFNTWDFLFHPIDLYFWIPNSVDAGTYEKKWFYFHIVDLCITIPKFIVAP